MINNEGQFSRRDFLKLSALGILGMGVTKVLPSIFSEKTSEKMESTMVNEVEVFGLEKKLTNQDQVDNLVFYFDSNFEKKLSWSMKQKNVWEQRELLLAKEQRFVEFVVKESVYKSFKSRKVETGVSYVEWVKLHIDLMNRVLHNAKPPVALSNLIARIIVIDDSFEKNPVKYSKDIDAMWFNDKDYRIRQDSGDIGQGAFWSFKHDNEGKLVLQNPAGAEFGRNVLLPINNDTFEAVRDGVWIDYGIIHELSHLLLNLPDEYVFSIEQANSIFKSFRFNTGSFMEPNMSPYLATLLNRNFKKGIRGYYTDPRSIGKAKDYLAKFNFYGEVPEKVSISAGGSMATDAYKSSYLFPDYYDKKDGNGKLLPCKKMEKDIGVLISGDSLVLKKELFNPQMFGNEGLFPVLFRFEFKHNGVDKEVYIPIGIFNMTKYSGVDDSQYNIEFTNAVAPKDMKSQTLNLMDQSELEVFTANNLVYAKMKVVGTSAWCVWSFQY